MSRLLIPLLLVAIVMAGVAVAQEGEVNHVPPPAPPVWGDVDRDREVDLKDLVTVAQDRDTLQENFGVQPEQVLAALDTRWA